LNGERLAGWLLSTDEIRRATVLVEIDGRLLRVVDFLGAASATKKILDGHEVIELLNLNGTDDAEKNVVVLKCGQKGDSK
jgi:hypothetical protein